MIKTEEKTLTYLQAIGILKCMAVDMTAAIADMAKRSPMYDVIVQRIDAINLAQKVLREKTQTL